MALLWHFCDSDTGYTKLHTYLLTDFSIHSPIYLAMLLSHALQKSIVLVGHTSLPNEVVEADAINTFKSRRDKHLIMQEVFYCSLLCRNARELGMVHGELPMELGRSAAGKRYLLHFVSKSAHFSAVNSPEFHM